MKCPQCKSRMDSAPSLTPLTGSAWNQFSRRGTFCAQTTHYRCEDCDAEYVLSRDSGEWKLSKIDGGNAPLGLSDFPTNVNDKQYD